MTSRPSWMALLEEGRDLIAKGAYDAGLKRCDEAVELGRSDADAIASREVVLERLRALNVAFGGGGGGEEGKVGGGDDQEEQDVPRLFEALSRLPPSHIDLLLSQPLAHTTPKEIDLHLTHSLTEVNFIDFLHPEILVEIASYLHDDGDALSSKSSFILASASRRWRTILLDHERLWGRLRVQDWCNQDLPKKIQVYSNIAPLRSLKISPRPLHEWRALGGLLQGKVQKVEELDISEIGRLDTQFPDLMLLFPSTDPVLKTLRLRAEDGYLQNVLPRSMFTTLTSLTTLRLEDVSCSAGFAFVYILSNLPNLQSLTLFSHDEDDDLRHPPPPPYLEPWPSTITAPHLHTLILQNYEPVASAPSFILPSLRLLDLTHSYHWTHSHFLFPPAHPPNVSKLAVLKIRGGGKSHELDSQTTDDSKFLSDLSQLVALTYLYAGRVDAIDDTFLDELMLNEGVGGTGEERAQMGICPLLEKLQIPGSRVTGGALKRMVASRLVEREGRTRLKELDVSGWAKLMGHSSRGRIVYGSRII